MAHLESIISSSGSHLVILTRDLHPVPGPKMWALPSLVSATVSLAMLLTRRPGPYQEEPGLCQPRCSTPAAHARDLMAALMLSRLKFVK